MENNGIFTREMHCSYILVRDTLYSEICQSEVNDVLLVYSSADIECKSGINTCVVIDGRKCMGKINNAQNRIGDMYLQIRVS